MLNSLRILLIWLLVLAIPAQGVAAATMLYCGPDHHGTRSDSSRDGSHGVAAPAHHHARDAEPRHQDHAMHDHAAHGGQNTESADAQAEVSVVTVATVAGVPDSSPEVKCSVCATCCNAAAIASSVLGTSSNQASPAPLPSVVASPVSFITDGPRRPPRSFLAQVVGGISRI